ncbi:MAG: glycosyltransferase [Herbinix sp.]|nr:glycosyltransferase [Herbinix sp.]
MDSIRKEQGWELKSSFNYEINTVHNSEAYQSALQLSKESDVIIIGSAPEIFVKERMKYRADGITYRYSERIYKRGKWRFLSPRGVIKRMDTYFRFHNRKLYMLCASAYTSADLMLHGSYLGKCYKWGYFPETIHYSLDDLMAKKVKGKTELLWCGRFIKCKHPEAAITLAILLKKQGIDFALNIIGSGERENMIRTMITENKLEECVYLLGVMKPEQVRTKMEESNIFLITSDFQEGWGAVVNEAMNSGCAVVASHAVGCAPFLINNGINGFIYKNGNINSLYRKVKELMLNRQLCENLGRKAYETIACEWNAEVAAKRLLLLTRDLMDKGHSKRFLSGPCSKADIIKNNWYSDKKN